MRKRGYHTFLMVLSCWALCLPAFSMQDFREQPDVNLYIVSRADAHCLHVPLFYECEESKEKANIQVSLVTAYRACRFLNTIFTPRRNRFHQVNFSRTDSMGLYLPLGAWRL